MCVQGVHSCVYVRAEARGWYCPSLTPFHLNFWNKVSHWTSYSFVLIDGQWSRKIPWSTPVLGLQTHTPVSGILTGVQGIKLIMTYAQCLLGKHFTYWAISQVPCIISVLKYFKQNSSHNGMLGCRWIIFSARGPVVGKSSHVLYGLRGILIVTAFEGHLITWLLWDWIGSYTIKVN